MESFEFNNVDWSRQSIVLFMRVGWFSFGYDM